MKAAAFRPRSRFEDTNGYHLLPLRFLRLAGDRYVATNLAGEHVVLPFDVLHALIEHRLGRDSPWHRELESRHFLSAEYSGAHLELLATQYRTRQSALPHLTALHIFVVTLRCDHSCRYCQVSRVSEDRAAYDMTPGTADRAIELMLQSPSAVLKIEIQGGESLLNFPLIQHITRRAKSRAQGRELQFVVATNLSLLTEEMLDFFAEHQFQISTSLDGPRTLHNHNRLRAGGDSYERTIDGIARCRTRLGPESVSALMTCTAESLRQPEAIVDEYVRQGFREIFLRHLSRYGFAAGGQRRIGYETEQFLAFYRRALARLLELNRRGVPIREVYASILLRRLLTSYPTGYVDLQSPTGFGLGVLVYNYDGDVYVSDEGRMLAEMGDRTFRVGNVHRDTWESLFTGSTWLATAHTLMSEGLPGCSDCAFQPYCGSDPIFNYSTQHSLAGHRPTSAFCRRNREILQHLILLMEDDPATASIFRRWAQ